ncbi:unnamed protein product [Rotaria sp. Silwood2]|nr:unnamed protein product [Rotaria sp. Silwood2]
MDESEFRAEYAKSDRSTCQGCQSTIDKNSLRLAIMVQSPTFDGKIPTWYHTEWFFFKVTPADAQITTGFDNLRWDGQEKILKKIDDTLENKLNDESSEIETDSEFFSVEYAKSNRSTCNSCYKNIDKNLVRLSTRFPTGYYKPTDNWYHVDCFKMRKNSLFLMELLKFDAVADCMTFDALEHCPECEGFLIFECFSHSSYPRTGDVTEWTKCTYSTRAPTRKPFDIPTDIKNTYDAFKSYNYKKRDRILAQVIEKQVTIAKASDVSRVIQESLLMYV